MNDAIKEFLEACERIKQSEPTQLYGRALFFEDGWSDIDQLRLRRLYTTRRFLELPPYCDDKALQDKCLEYWWRLPGRKALKVVADNQVQSERPKAGNE